MTTLSVYQRNGLRLVVFPEADKSSEAHHLCEGQQLLILIMPGQLLVLETVQCRLIVAAHHIADTRGNLLNGCELFEVT